MSTLHLIRTSAYHSNELSVALTTALANDGIILIDDGCYNLKHALIAEQNHHTLQLSIYAIDTHCQARSITPDNKVTVISMAQLVELSFQYNKVLTWQ